MAVRLLKRLLQLNEESPNQQGINLTKMLTRVQQLPTLSDTAVRAMALANNPDTSMSTYVALIKQDSALAASVLRMANSALYGCGHQTANLHQAVVRLGMRTCSNLVMAMSMRGAFRPVDPQIKEACELLLSHCALTGFLAGAFNEALALGYHGEEFTGGLLHDIGRLVLAVGAPTEFVRADKLQFDEHEAVLAQEKAAIGVDHATIGVQYGTRNRLPGPVLNCIKYHHNPAQASADAKLVQLIAMVDHLANHILRDHRITNYELRHNPGFLLLANSWDQTMSQKVHEVMPKVVVAALRQARALVSAQVS